MQCKLYATSSIFKAQCITVIAQHSIDREKAVLIVYLINGWQRAQRNRKKETEMFTLHHHHHHHISWNGVCKLKWNQRHYSILEIDFIIVCDCCKMQDLSCFIDDYTKHYSCVRMKKCLSELISFLRENEQLLVRDHGFQRISLKKSLKSNASTFDHSKK